VRGDDWCQRCQLWSIRSDSCRFSLVVRLVEMLLKTILVFILVSFIKCTRFVIEYGTDKITYASIEV
jgi:hypothetical protein